VPEWKPNSFQDTSSIKSEGLSAGLDAQGKECYIGRGTAVTYLSPGRLLIEDDGNRKAGLYVESNGSEYYVTSNVEYLVKDPKCNYKWVPSSNGDPVANAIEFTSNLRFYVGRVSNGNSVEVGKVVVEQGGGMNYGNGKLTYSYEVLICVSMCI
jgi:hypothetical protein